jgi:hypothetical protein
MDGKMKSRKYDLEERLLDDGINETEELMKIFVTSIKAAEKNKG